MSDAAKKFLDLVRQAHGGKVPTGTRVTKYCERAKKLNIECPVHSEGCPLLVKGDAP